MRVLLFALLLASCHSSQEEIQGPQEITQLLTPQKATPQEWHPGKQRLAIYLTTEECHWQGMTSALRTIGVPYVTTRDLDFALMHRVVLLYPVVSGQYLSSEQVASCEQFVEEGGTLVGFSVLGSLSHLFGCESSDETKKHYQLELLDHPLNRLPFTDPLVYFDEGFGTCTYLPTEDTEVVAIYNDGSTAILRRQVGKGEAIAWGVDLGFFALRCRNQRMGSTPLRYCNTLCADLDLLLYWFKELYRAREPYATLIETVPFGKPLTVLVTHDIDFIDSMQNVKQYAEFERKLQIPATYFVQTKYVKDFHDQPFFDEKGMRILRKLTRIGMELGSHSVAHAQNFAQLPLGTGREWYPRYRPFVEDAKCCRGGTWFGELRVSKFLLEECCKTSVSSFRSGFLRTFSALPQLLASTSYAFSSCTTSGTVRTHFPFPWMWDMAYATELDLFEFPISLEDEMPPPLQDNLDASISLARDLARYGAPCLLLLHPNKAGGKLHWMRAWLEAVRPWSAFATVAQFGAWWRARYQLEVDLLDVQEGRMHLQLTCPQPIERLVLSLPVGWTIVGENPEMQQEGQQLLIAKGSGIHHIYLWKYND